MYLSSPKPSHLICGLVVALCCAGSPADLLGDCEVTKVAGTERLGYFGSSTALSGKWGVIGAPNAGGFSEPGVAKIYRFDDPTRPTRYLLRPSHPLGFAGFGAAVSIDADVAVIGEGGINCPYVQGLRLCLRLPLQRNHLG